MRAARTSTAVNVFINAKTSVLTAAYQLLELRSGRLTVIDGRSVVGYVTTRELVDCVSARMRPSKTPVSAIMAKVVCAPSRLGSERPIPSDVAALDPEGCVHIDIRMTGGSGLTIPALLAQRGTQLPMKFVNAI